jgi:hypothetical protein
MFGNNKQLEAARIFHYVNGCEWTKAKYFALRATEAELDDVIRTHPNWRQQ